MSRPQTSNPTQPFWERDLEPIPNKTFTYEELEYLWRNGYIYESNNVFYASVPDAFR